MPSPVRHSSIPGYRECLDRPSTFVTRMLLLCGSCWSALGPSLPCTRILQTAENARLSVSKCTECKVHKVLVNTWTSAGLALSLLHFPKLQEAPTSSDTLCLPLLNSHCPETPSVCMALLSLHCHCRSQPAASAFCMGTAFR